MAVFAFEIWHVLSARAGTPAPILDRLRAETASALASAQVLERITAMGIDATPTTGEAAAARVTAELARWVPP